MTIFHQVAWRGSASRYSFGPATAIHLLPEGETKALCGVAIPPEVMPGVPYNPENLLSFSVKFLALDCTDETEFGVNERRECKRCLSRQAKGTSS